MSEGNIIHRSDDWWWGSATIDLPINDYQLDAIVSITPTESGKNNSAGFVFRKMENSAAAFYIWQPLGGYAAQAEILGECKHWSKESTFALSKDTETGDHHLRALVQDNLANFYIDGQLACILDLTDCPKGSVGMWPAVCEQSVCMPVMSGHTMHYALLLNELYQATGDSYYYKAAVSAANTGFDIATGDEQWYSLICTPLFFGLDLASELRL